jgi:cysteinyl-tRNA synthetase
MALGCQGPSSGPADTSRPNAGAPSGGTRGGGDWQKVRHWLYQLQNLDVDRVAASQFDLVVTDYSSDGSDDERLSPAQVGRLQASPQGRRLVLAYMSIGEAEDYRSYWQRDWRPGSPSWLHPVNPQWKGNYPVEYWQPAWKSIIFGSPGAYLDKIIDAGFDGVYLDVIEAYEVFENQRPSARQDMAQFVREIATYARETRGKRDFGVFPQNGEPLADVPGYIDVVSGIGREDLYYGNPDDNRASPARFTAEAEGYLDRYVKAGKLVLSVDYTQRPEQVADGYKRAQARGYVHYATVRGLDRMVINDGFDPR